MHTNILIKGIYEDGFDTRGEAQCVMYPLYTIQTDSLLTSCDSQELLSLVRHFITSLHCF